MKYVWLFMAIMFAYAIGIAVAQEEEPARVPYSGTVLVGTGCQGSSDIAVAYEEDALPVCKSIDIHIVR